MNSRERGLGPAANHQRTNSSVSNNSTLAITNDKEDPKSSECTSDDEDDFQDAVTDPDYVEFTVSGAPVHRRTISSVSTGSVDPEDGAMEGEEGTDYSSDQEDPNILTIVQKRPKSSQTNGKLNTSSNNSSPVRRLPGKQRRSRIPDKPDISFSLWSIMKNCIGKDLSKIPIPVNFSEPISFLQRLNEDFEYSEVLDRASEAADDYEQLALVAAFTVSSYRYLSNAIHLINIKLNGIDLRINSSEKNTTYAISVPQQLELENHSIRFFTRRSSATGARTTGGAASPSKSSTTRRWWPSTARVTTAGTAGKSSQ